MALTGLEIFKLLPNTNCGDCGVPTCLAFAMKLAGKAASIDECPHASEEAKQILGQSQAPPIHTVKIGSNETHVEVGGELVLFRHDKTFYHQSAIAVEVSSDLEEGQLRNKLKNLKKLTFERVGEEISVDLILVRDTSKDAEKFRRSIEIIRHEGAWPLILFSTEKEILNAGLEATTGTRPLVGPISPKNYEELIPRIKSSGASALLTCGKHDLDHLADLAGKVSSLGLKDIVLNPGGDSLGEALKRQVMIRRLAIQEGFKDLGFPTYLDANLYNDPICSAALGVCKYASIISFKIDDPASILPLLVLRQNIYSDPQRPLQVDPGLHAVGEPLEESPLMVTTNFSLTYFTVTNETEGSGLPAHMLVADTDGMSVLTAWSANKFGASDISKLVKESGVEDKLKHKNLIIPGYVAMLSGELEDQLPGWTIMVGPQEASDIPSYLRNQWNV